LLDIHVDSNVDGVSSQASHDVRVVVSEDHVAIVELRRPPNNFFDVTLIRALVDAYEALDENDDCRAIVLCSQGKHFCAGADFSPKERTPAERADESNLYREAIRLFETAKPVVAAVQGGAIGGGLGLACSTDMRVASPESRFAANSSRLGFHHGFGLSVTLPGIVGQQKALDLLYRGRRIDGAEALGMGLCDSLAPAEKLRGTAHALAADIAASAPLAVQAIRHTLRGDLSIRVRTALDHELSEQRRLQATQDFAEGVRASAERRIPVFRGL
jgi:enoyl-CoA hydratase/carnithine racemase